MHSDPNHLGCLEDESDDLGSTIPPKNGKGYNGAYAAGPYSAFVLVPGTYLMHTLGRITEWNMGPEFRPPQDKTPEMHLSFAFPETYDDFILDQYPLQEDSMGRDRDDIDLAYLLEPVKGHKAMHFPNGNIFFFAGFRPIDVYLTRSLKDEISDMLSDPKTDIDYHNDKEEFT